MSFAHAGSFRFSCGPEPLSLSVMSWPLLRLEPITRNAHRMATPCRWTHGALSWRIVGGRMRAWLWWRLTCADCRTLDETCQCSSTGGRKSSTLDWTKQDHNLNQKVRLIGCFVSDLLKKIQYYKKHDFSLTRNAGHDLLPTQFLSFLFSMC